MQDKQSLTSNATAIPPASTACRAADTAITSLRSKRSPAAAMIGLVSAVHEPERCLDEALELARRYAAGPASIRLAKAAILDGLHLPLAEGVKLEAARFGDTFATDDARIGVASFIEKGPGKATFTGR